MSRDAESFVTFAYRGVISVLIAATFFLVKENYNEFKAMKISIQGQEIKDIVVDGRLQNIESRVTIIEKRVP